ncbi:MAG: hypothetical protein HDR88_17285 [Bacteroides sp.]|nr:hypothetical protein [Bacteroides sp.]
MDLIEINHTIGCLSAELSLYECDMNNVSLVTLKKLSNFLKESHLDFDRGARAAIRDKAAEFFMGELYASLTDYSNWYVENKEESCTDEICDETRTIFEQIELMWRPLIEDLFPKFINPNREKETNTDNDPEGYNKLYGKPGEKYRSIRYDIVENPEYPYLTKSVIFDRLKGIISSFPTDGADISRLLSLAFKHGLLVRIPYRKSVMRELGMTSLEQSLSEFISSKDDEISYSKRLEAMKEELLRE